MRVPNAANWKELAAKTTTDRWILRRETHNLSRCALVNYAKI